MARKGPLRKVVREYIEEIPLRDGYALPRAMEELECGHTQRVLTDIYGEFHSYRRRCGACAGPKPKQRGAEEAGDEAEV